MCAKTIPLNLISQKMMYICFEEPVKIRGFYENARPKRVATRSAARKLVQQYEMLCPLLVRLVLSGTIGDLQKTGSRGDGSDIEPVIPEGTRTPDAAIAEAHPVVVP